VLVIEDNPRIRDLFAEFLEVLGYEADVAVDGREGVARFDPIAHQVVVTDCVMPGLTGFDVAETIRARSWTTPIVMICAADEPHHERRAAQAGVRFLRKPISFAQFKATLAEVVQHAGAGREGSRG